MHESKYYSRILEEFIQQKQNEIQKQGQEFEENLKIRLKQAKKENCVYLQKCLIELLAFEKMVTECNIAENKLVGDIGGPNYKIEKDGVLIGIKLPAYVDFAAHRNQGILYFFIKRPLKYFIEKGKADLYSELEENKCFEIK